MALPGGALALVWCVTVLPASIRRMWPRASNRSMRCKGSSVALPGGALALVWRVTVLAGIYPARVAAGIEPIDAVHEE